jgi:hypothetical protein
LVKAAQLAPMPADAHVLCQAAADQLGTLIAENRRMIEKANES